MGEWVPLEDKILQRNASRRFRIRHPGKFREANRLYMQQKQKENPGYRNEIARTYQWKKLGFTSARYDRMFLDRSGCCDICHLPAERPLNLDHDHRTGVIRGLLCTTCNLTLGWFERYSPSIVEYLQ
jgi:hypothetical protein